MFYTVEVEKVIKEEKKEGSKDDGGKKSRISVDLDSKHDITYILSIIGPFLNINFSRRYKRESKDFCTYGITYDH